MNKPLLRVDGLSISTKGGKEILKNISFDLAAGRSLGILGSSGSGKSTLALAIKGLLGDSISVSGSISFKGVEVVGCGISQGIGMIFQDISSSINPAFTINDQLSDVIMESQKIKKTKALMQAKEMLSSFGLGVLKGVAFYPYQLSGGMKQRFLAAMAIATEPSLLIADEPTSNLDIMTSANVLRSIDEYRKKSGCAYILISHDLSILREMVSDIIVMDKGEIIEAGPMRVVIDKPKSQAARKLVESELTIEGAGEFRLSRNAKQTKEGVSGVKGR